jgi:integrase/recombinase XerD
MDEKQRSHEAVQGWMSYLERQGKSPLTREAYLNAVTHFVNWMGQAYRDEFDPQEVMPRDLREWKAHQQTVEKASPNTINQRLVAMGRFFAWAHGENLIQMNPAADVDLISVSELKPKGLDGRSLRKLLRAVHKYGSARDIAVVELLAGTGLRVSELLQLSIGDIRIGERSGEVTVRKGKHSGFRVIPLTRDLRHTLSSYLAGHPQKEDLHSPVWLGIRGELKHRSSIFRILNKYTKLADLQSMGPHTLRHTFAYEYLQANPDDIRGLAALLGHSNINTVMIYTQPSLEDLNQRMERVAF